MQRIIKGKSYNTETAVLVAEADNGCWPRDVHFCWETLYRKRTGEYFLHLKGGPASPAGHPVGQNSWIAGEKIKPMTFNEVLEWAEDRLNVEEYKNLFGEPPADDKAVVATIINPESKMRLEQEASRLGLSQRALLEQMIEKLPEIGEPSSDPAGRG